MRKALLALLLLTLTVPGFAALPGNVPSLAPMLKKVTPAVVNVTTEGRQQPANPFLNDPNFRRFFGEQAPEREVRGLGSGVIVDAAKGLVLTNHHVIANADKIRVRLADDREYEAELVGSDPDSDVAVLKIPAENLTAVPIGDSRDLEVGDFVVAIGNPFGLRQTVTSGIVSALDRSGLGNRYENFIQTDASINRGNSGGALVNLLGELVGINTAILSGGGGSIGIGFAIPTELARSVMDQIVEHGGVKRGMLGVIGQDLTPELAKAFGLERGRGAVVARIFEGSAAEKADIRQGDVVIAVDDHQIRDFDDLRNQIGLHREGDKLKLTLMRDGKQQTVKVKLGPSQNLDGGRSAVHAKLEGARFGNLPASHPRAGDITGVLIMDVAAGSPAARAGLLAGDIVSSINRRGLGTLDELREILDGLNAKDELLLHVHRGEGALFLLVR